MNSSENTESQGHDIVSNDNAADVVEVRGLPAGDIEEERGYTEALGGESYNPSSDPLLEEMYKRGRARGERGSMGGMVEVYHEVANELAVKDLLDAARDVVSKAKSGGYGIDGETCPFVKRLDKTIGDLPDKPVS